MTNKELKLMITEKESSKHTSFSEASTSSKITDSEAQVDEKIRYVLTFHIYFTQNLA